MIKHNKIISEYILTFDSSLSYESLILRRYPGKESR